MMSVLGGRACSLGLVAGGPRLTAPCTRPWQLTPTVGDSLWRWGHLESAAPGPGGPL